MSAERIRELRPTDLDAVVALWQQAQAEHRGSVYGLSEVLASCQQDDAVVAVRDNIVVGAAVGRAAHEQGWVVFFAVDPALRGEDTGRRLLLALERRLAARGLGIISALIPDSEQDGASLDDFAQQGFEAKRHLRYVERRIPTQGRELQLLRELGGRVLPRGLWDAVGGMTREKAALERRLVLPLAQPDVAERFGVVPPKAVVLFGPPGTGKTTFAKAIASRLEWPFIEVFPSRLGGDPAALAAGLRETFTRIEELDHAVVFIDEVEEIASHRKGDPPGPLQGVTNELLKIIPAFREREGRLLICATNFIRSLDAALLRHGRFDYVIPIGLPDPAARTAIWSGYVPEPVRDAVELERLVADSAGLTPADIEFAARQAAQAALERAVAGPVDGGEADGPSTDDYLAALADIRPTVSPATIEEFLEDIAALGRL